MTQIDLNEHKEDIREIPGYWARFKKSGYFVKISLILSVLTLPVILLFIFRVISASTVFLWASEWLSELGVESNLAKVAAVGISLGLILLIPYMFYAFWIGKRHRVAILLVAGVSASIFMISWWARKEHNFNPSTGEPTRFCVKRPDGNIFTSQNPGFDPIFGEKLHACTRQDIFALKGIKYVSEHTPIIQSQSEIKKSDQTQELEKAKIKTDQLNQEKAEEESFKMSLVKYQSHNEIQREEYLSDNHVSIMETFNFKISEYQSFDIQYIKLSKQEQEKNSTYELSMWISNSGRIRTPNLTLYVTYMHNDPFIVKVHALNPLDSVWLKATTPAHNFKFYKSSPGPFHITAHPEVRGLVVNLKKRGTDI